jgi:hypothetical protein
MSGVPDPEGDAPLLERLRTVAGAVRRHWFALLGVALLVAAPAVPWVLVADVHRSVAWDPVDTDRAGPEVMADVTDQLREVDHRRVSRAYLLANGSRERYATFETVREFSRYQYAATFVRWGPPADTALFGQRFLAEVSVDGPVQVVQYADDTLVGLGYRFVLDPAVLPEEPVGDRTVALPPGARGVSYNRTSAVGPNRSLAGLYRPYFSPRGGGWEVQSRNESAVVVGIDDPEAVFATVPMGARAVHPGTRLRVVLDATTGKPERVVEHRVVTQRVDGEILRRHYVVVTRYSEWGSADAREPAWLGDTGFDDLVEDLLYY